MLPRILTRVVDWVRAHRQFGVEFATHGSATWVFIRVWKAGEFVRLAVAIIDRYYGDANSELAILGKILSGVGSGASLVALVGGSHTLVECYKEYLGSGYTKTLVDYPVFDARLLKRCLQKTASVVFGTLDPFSMTEFIVARLKGAEHRDWIESRQSLRRAIETGDLSLPSLLDVVSNIVGVWPLIVVYLKETGKKDNGDSLVVWFFLLSFFAISCSLSSVFSCLEKRDRWILLRRSVGQNEVSSVPSHSGNVLVFSSTCHHGVVGDIPTRVLAVGILGVDVSHSWWYPHWQMFRDF